MERLCWRPARRGALLLAGVCLLALAGCSGQYSVRGKLVYDEEGKPPVTELAGHTVTFSSENLGISARGEIQPDGTFTLGTDKPGNGVPPGVYKVTIEQNHPRPGRPDRSPPVVEDYYEDPISTPLQATVEAKKNEFTFALKRRHKAGKDEKVSERE
jgi:hypothetical protein